MSFGNEIKDFVAAFQVGAGAVNNRREMDAKMKYMASQANYYDARSKYYSEGGAAGAKDAGPAGARARGENEWDQRNGVADVAGGGKGGASDEVKAEIVRGAQAVQEKYGYDPKDLVGIVGYETGGTYNPWQMGPNTSTRGGSPNYHIGLIQWGANERKQYGITKDMPVYDQMLQAGKFLSDRGFKPNMDFAQMYSTINAGRPGRLAASDSAVGGAPGSVLDKVNSPNMKQHRQIAAGLFNKFAGGATPQTEVADAGTETPAAIPAPAPVKTRGFSTDPYNPETSPGKVGALPADTYSPTAPVDVSMDPSQKLATRGALPLTSPQVGKPMPQAVAQDFVNRTAKDPAVRNQYLAVLKKQGYDTSLFDEPGDTQQAAIPLN